MAPGHDENAYAGVAILARRVELFQRLGDVVARVALAFEDDCGASPGAILRETHDEIADFAARAAARDATGPGLANVASHPRNFGIIEGADANFIVWPEKAECRAEAGEILGLRSTSTEQAPL